MVKDSITEATHPLLVGLKPTRDVLYIYDWIILNHHLESETGKR